MQNLNGKLLLLQLAHEFLGCMFLGAFLNVTWQTFALANVIDMLVLAFLVWLAYAFAYRVSGGHLNPAITVVNMCRLDGTFNWVQGLAYIPIQFLGHCAGIFFAWWVMRAPGELKIYKDATTNEYWYAEAVGQEVAAGFIFALIHLLQTNATTAISHNQLFQSALIAFTFAALYYWSHLRTGGSNNPAFGLANCLLDVFDDGDDDSMKFAWIYVVCPVVGALLAWPLYQFVYVKAHEQPVVQEARNKV